MNIRERAQAASRAKLDREEAEEARKEYERREAHMERLRTLCTTILQLPEPPFIRWCGVHEAVSGYRTPVACIDGFCFTCMETDEFPSLITFKCSPDSMYSQYLTIPSTEELGRILPMWRFLGHMVGDTIIPLERRAAVATSEEIEAQLKPIGEAAVKRLRKEHGMERTVKHVQQSPSGHNWWVVEDGIILGTISSKENADKFAASDLMLEALKAHNEAREHHKNCIRCDWEPCQYWWPLWHKAGALTLNAIKAAEGKEIGDAE